jgi:hypothetical protein
MANSLTTPHLLAQKLFQVFDKSGEVGGDDLPQDVKVNLIVAVDEAISKTYNFLPKEWWNTGLVPLWKSDQQLLRESLVAGQQRD